MCGNFLFALEQTLVTPKTALKTWHDAEVWCDGTGEYVRCDRMKGREKTGALLGEGDYIFGKEQGRQVLGSDA